MKPLYIKLRGFKGFSEGVGLEEVELDFRSLPDGLIGIIGENGMGKTTLIDNLHPYRIMPYKLRESKDWSYGAFNYYDQCYGRDALKELVFEEAGVTYKSVVMIDADKRKQEAYLFKEDHNGTWVPYSEAVKAGKTKEYDAAVEEVCGSPAMFFSSRFRSQDARKISSYPRSEIMSLISELLNINNIKEQGDKATKVANALLAIVADKEKQKASITELLASKGDILLQLDTVNSSIATTDANIKRFREEITANESAIQDLELANAAQEVTRRRVSDLRSQLSALHSDIQETEREKQEHQNEARAKTAGIEKEIGETAARVAKEQMQLREAEERERTAVSSELESIASKKAQAQTILSRSDEINSAVIKDTELSDRIELDRKSLDTKRSSLEALNVDIASLRAIDNELVSANARLAQLKEQAAGLNGLDCNGDGSGAVNRKCKLLAAAVSAEQQIPAIEREIEELKLKQVTLPSKIEEASRIKTEGVALSKTISDNEKELKEVRSLAQLVFELDNASARIEELTQLETAAKERLARRVEEIKSSIESLANSLSDRTKELESQLATVTKTCSAVMDKLDSKLAQMTKKASELSEEIRRIESSLEGNTAEEISKLQSTVSSHRAELERLEECIKGLHGQHGGLQTQLVEMESKEVELEKLETEILCYMEEISNWKIIAKA